MDKRYESTLAGLLPEGVEIEVFSTIRGVAGDTQLVGLVVETSLSLSGDIDHEDLDDLWDAGLLEDDGHVKSWDALNDARLQTTSLGPVIEALRPLVLADAEKASTAAIREGRGSDLFTDGVEMIA